MVGPGFNVLDCNRAAAAGARPGLPGNESDCVARRHYLALRSDALSSLQGAEQRMEHELRK